MSSVGMPGEGNGAPQLPNFQVVGQYIKDLSFENPGAPANLTVRPNIPSNIKIIRAHRLSNSVYIELKDFNYGN